jgi:predicted 3-demethylubiquinone-9 3-methyltransferase (glyoxalase superfamily)
MQKIIPSLWFDNNCEEAMKFYTAIFPDSRILSTRYYPEHAEDEHLQDMSGKVLHGEFEVCGVKMIALDGGPVFKFNPSISFMVHCDDEETVNDLWQKLSEGDSKVMMELGEYPFSRRYGWIQDRFGLSWQLLMPDPAGAAADPRPKLIPSIMFINQNAGQAESAREFYLSVFKDSQPGNIFYFEPGTAPDEDSKVAYEDFRLLGEWFAAMDGGRSMHDFDLNAAISFTIDCKDQQEVDYYWDKLSAVPEAEQCGWVQDKFGVSWQIVPERLGELMNDPDGERAGRVLEALMKMKKIDVAELEAAADAQ